MKHRYLTDPHWYIAFFLAIIFWVIYDLFVQTATPKNLLETPQIILLSVIIYPILEEIVFRGMIQSQLAKRLNGRAYLGLSLANIYTSLLFSVLHFIHQPPLMAALIFFPSLVFGYFKDRHHTVLPSIYLHMFYNAGFLILFN